MSSPRNSHEYPSYEPPFPTGVSKEAWSSYALSPEQLAAFERNGYLAGLPVLGENAVDLVRAALGRIHDRLDELEPHLYEVEAASKERPDEVVFHMLGAWRVEPILKALLFHPAITVPAAQLLKTDRVRFWHDQVFSKPPHHPGVVPWHQDYSYWTRVGPPRHLTFNLLLDEGTEESGCLRFLRGSHRWPLQDRVPFDGPMEGALATVPKSLLSDADQGLATGLPGTASIHDSHTMHGSFANNSDHPRRAVVINVMHPDTRVLDDSEPLLAGVPHLKKGAVVAGEDFPILLDRNRR